MATGKGQRIGILVITIVMIVGTIGSFALMVLGTENQAREAKQQQERQALMKKDYEAWQAKIDAQADELSKRYYEEFKQYAAHVAAFDRDSVKALATEDLKAGEGAEVQDGTKYSTYYIGWNPQGKIFDQSIDGDKLKTPLPSGGSLIQGWAEGIKGMKIGGVRLITIPSDKAYGDQAKSDDIPPNTPLKFIVMPIEQPAEIPVPDSLKGLV